MEAKYKYALVDAQYILTRNFHKVKGLRSFSKEMLASVIFNSICVALRNTGHAEKVVLVWDKHPYHKFEILDEYKGDRYYASLDDIDENTPENEAEEIRESVRLDEIKMDCKYLMMTSFGEIGLPSISKAGFEADDHIYAFSRQYMEAKKCLLITSDSDWKGFVTPSIDLYHVTREEVYDYDYVLSEMPPTLRDKMSYYEYDSIIGSLDGTHNNLTKVLNSDYDKMSWEELIPKFLEDHTPFVTDEELYQKQKLCFNIEALPEYDKIFNRFRYIDTFGEYPGPFKLSEWELANGINLNDGNYKAFRAHLNKELFKKE